MSIYKFFHHSLLSQHYIVATVAVFSFWFSTVFLLAPFGGLYGLGPKSVIIEINCTNVSEFSSL